MATQIGNFRTREGLRKQALDYKDNLALSIRLEKQSEEAINKLYANRNLGITPAPLQPLNLESKVITSLKDKEEAFAHLLQISQYGDARKILDRLVSSGDVATFNHHANNFISKLKPRTILSSEGFNDLWKQYELRVTRKEIKQNPQNMSSLELEKYDGILNGIAKNIEKLAKALPETEQAKINRLVREDIADRDIESLTEFRNELKENISDLNKGKDPRDVEDNLKEILKKYKENRIEGTVYDEEAEIKGEEGPKSLEELKLLAKEKKIQEKKEKMQHLFPDRKLSYYEPPEKHSKLEKYLQQNALDQALEEDEAFNRIKENERKIRNIRNNEEAYNRILEERKAELAEFQDNKEIQQAIREQRQNIFDIDEQKRMSELRKTLVPHVRSEPSEKFRKIKSLLEKQYSNKQDLPYRKFVNLKEKKEKDANRLRQLREEEALKRLAELQQYENKDETEEDNRKAYIEGKKEGNKENYDKLIKKIQFDQELRNIADVEKRLLRRRNSVSSSQEEEEEPESSIPNSGVDASEQELSENEGYDYGSLSGTAKTSESVQKLIDLYNRADPQYKNYKSNNAKEKLIDIYNILEDKDNDFSGIDKDDAFALRDNFKTIFPSTTTKSIKDIRDVVLSNFKKIIDNAPEKPPISHAHGLRNFVQNKALNRKSSIRKSSRKKSQKGNGLKDKIERSLKINKVPSYKPMSSCARDMSHSSFNPTRKQIHGYGLDTPVLNQKILKNEVIDRDFRDQYKLKNQTGRCYTPKKDYLVPFGRYMICTKNLSKGILHLLHKSRIAIIRRPKVIISNAMVHIIYDLLNTGKISRESYENLQPDDRELFDNTIIFCQLKQASEHEKNIFNKERDNDVKRFNVLKGEILAGNDAPEILKELKLLCLKFSANGTMTKKECTTMIYQIVVASEK